MRCPMLPIKTILHPTDFSPHANDALQMACALARDYHAGLILLHVRSTPPVPFGEFGVPPPEMPEAPEVIRNALQSEGIPCVLEGAQQAGVTGLSGIPIKVQVRPEDADQATAFIQAHEQGVRSEE